MGKINVLSFAVANLIAAGEVVDRPASAVKEMVENAIDAGAKRITVEVRNGGVTLMRVTDDGCGMSAEDLPMAIRRHATSKIREAEDLEGIATLGFRGEALAAISSVSDLRIISRTADAETGAMLTVEKGNFVGVHEHGCPVGTTVMVENLFANVPARRKFLKRDVTEGAAVLAVVEKMALSHPEIAFRCISEGECKLETAGNGDLKSAIYAIYGRDTVAKCLPVSWENEGTKVEGFIGRPDAARGNRNGENFFVNNRYIRSKTAASALEQAYSSYMAVEKFPFCVLNIEVNPLRVDVNVHPAKLEVKFSNEKLIFEAVYYAVRGVLNDNSARPTIVPEQTRRVSDAFAPVGRGEKIEQTDLFRHLPPKTEEKKPETPFYTHMTAGEYRASAPAEPSLGAPLSPSAPSAPIRDSLALHSPGADWPAVAQKPKAETPPSASPAPEQTVLPYRIIGEAFLSYVLVEQGDALLLIDKHAAHERILFEKMKASLHASLAEEVRSQMLMLPLEVELSAEERQTLSSCLDELSAIGFIIEQTEPTFSVSAIPEGIATAAVPDMLSVMAAQMSADEGDVSLTRDTLFEKALYRAACKAAIKAGREYTDADTAWIVSELMRTPDITVCPHGRPVAVKITHAWLDTKFGRT